MAANRALNCHGPFYETIWHSEIGASAAILDNGYNLDCLLVKYQGVDWRNSSFHDCNGGHNPTWEGVSACARGCWWSTRVWAAASCQCIAD